MDQASSGEAAKGENLTLTPTSHEQELQNIEKCLAAGFDEVIVVAPNSKHLASLRKFIAPQLEEKDEAKVRYFSPEELIAYLNEVQRPQEAERTVRG